MAIEAKVKAWYAAHEHERRATLELNKARAELFRLEQALGQALIPDDAQCGEEFQIWFWDGLLRVRIQDKRGDALEQIFDVGWRKHLSPKSQMHMH